MRRAEGAPADVAVFLGPLAAPNAITGFGYLGGVVGAAFLLAEWFVWVELLVRSTLLYRCRSGAPGTARQQRTGMAVRAACGQPSDLGRFGRCRPPVPGRARSRRRQWPRR